MISSLVEKCYKEKKNRIDIYHHVIDLKKRGTVSLYL